MPDLIALRAGTRNSALGSYLGGRESALGEQRAQMQNRGMQMEQAQQSMRMIGSVALGAMGGDLNGEVDPQKFEQGLDLLAQNGMDVSQYRGKPGIAKVAAQGSLDVLQTMRMAQNQQQLELALRKFEFQMQDAARQSTEVGLTPQTGVDAQGNPVLIQVSKSGKAVQTEMPEGVTLSKQPIKLDAGTHFVILDPVTRQQVGVIPKDVAGEAQAKETGKQTGEAIANLPKVEANAQLMRDVIIRLENHPGLHDALGSVQGRLPSALANPANMQSVDDFRAIKKQLEGQQFLQAFESLKGGGHITEIEGVKATDAIAAMQATQSDKQFIENLNILKEIIRNGVDRARRRAGIGTTTESYRKEVELPVDQRRDLSIAGGTPENAIVRPVEDDIETLLNKYGQ